MHDVGRGLTPRQIYEFDARGYVTIPGFLDPGRVARLNDLIDAHHGAHGVAPDLFPVLPVGRPFWDLLADPRALAIAAHLCGDRFRADHAYGLQRPPLGTPGEDTDEDLHGGPHDQESIQYQWIRGRSHVGQLVLGYVLEPVRPGDGGLVLVPGSHKNPMGLSGREVWELVEHSHDNSLCVQPVLDAGDLLVFPESIIHGTRRWQNRERRRRNLYYKYCPGHACWRDYAQWGLPMHEAAQTDVERSLLRPPFVGRYREDEAVMSGRNDWRAATQIDP